MWKSHNLKVTVHYTAIILLFSLPILWADYLRYNDIKNTLYDLIIKVCLIVATALLILHHHINTRWLYGLRICYFL